MNGRVSTTHESNATLLLGHRAVVQQSLSGPEDGEKLVEWTKCALVSLVGLSENENEQIREDAAWALGEIGVSKESLGMTLPGPRPERPEEIRAEVEESNLRLELVAGDIWESARV